MRSVYKEIIDIGVWSIGFCALLAVPIYVARETGPIEAIEAVGFLAAAVFVLGVTGYHAIESIDNVLGDGDDLEEIGRDP